MSLRTWKEKGHFHTILIVIVGAPITTLQPLLISIFWFGPGRFEVRGFNVAMLGVEVGIWFCIKLY